MTARIDRARRWILVAAAAGIALRAAFGLVYWVDKPLTHDEREYLSLARSLSEGRGFSYPERPQGDSTPRFGRAPLYPAFLALIGAGRTEHDDSPVRVKLAQAFLGGLGVWLIGALAWQAAGPRAAMAAAAVAAVYPPLVWIPAYVFSETVYSTVALTAAFLLQRAYSIADASRRPVREGLAAGALAGIAILIRPVMLFFVPLAVLWLIAGRRGLLALGFAGAALATVAPWTIRNALVHERFVLVASEGGVTFWTGNHPLARGEGDLAANPELKRAEVEFRGRHPDLTSEELEPLYYREALGWIVSEPGEWAALVARKLFYTIVPVGPSYTLHSTKYWAASLLSYGVLLPFAIAGLVRLWRARERGASALLLLAASSIVAGLVFFPQERFRIPVIDPALIVAASALAARRAHIPAGALR